VSPRIWFVSATRRRVAAIALILLPLVAVAAGSRDAESAPAGPTSPTPPSGVANISGRWTGTSGWEQNGIHAIANVTMSFTQDDRLVTGTLTSTSPAYQGWNATISGIVAGRAPDTHFVGTIELRAPSATGTGTCAGRAVFSGRSVTESLRWETSQLRVTSNADGEPAAACRGVLKNVALIMSR
jgi:hypothetical protein